MEDTNKKYEIILNEQQLVLIESAMELIGRIGLLQYKEIFRYINSIEYGVNKKNVISNDFIDLFTKQLKSHVVGNTTDDESLTLNNAFRGITCDEIPIQSKQAFDIYQVLRYTRSWENAEHQPIDRWVHTSQYISVNYDNPIKFSNLPLIKCTHIKKQKDE